MEENVSTANDVPENEPKKRAVPPTRITRQQLLDAHKYLKKLPKYKPDSEKLLDRKVSLSETKDLIMYLMEKKEYPIEKIPQLLIESGMPRFYVKELNELLYPTAPESPADDAAEMANYQ